MILQGIALHVNQNHEVLREKWVDHEGKLGLLVIRDDFKLGWPTNNWSEVVDGNENSFRFQLESLTVKGLAEDLTPDLSNWT